MFYNSNQVSKLITCQVCSKVFDDPRMLPCGHTFCARCIRASLISDGEESNNIECRSCGRRDLINVDKLPVNAMACEFIWLKPREINQSEKVKKLRDKQTLLGETVSEFKNSVFIGIDEVKNHCAKIKLEIDLETESRIEELRLISEQMKKEIDDYESGCVKEFDSKLAQDVNEKVLASYDQLKSETDTYLERFDMTENETDQLILKHEQMYDKMEIDHAFLKARKFNSTIIKFSKSDWPFERKAIGNIYSAKYNTDVLKLKESLPISMLSDCYSTVTHVVKSRIVDDQYFALYLDKSNRITVSSFNSKSYEIIKQNLLTYGSLSLGLVGLAESNDDLIISISNRCSVDVDRRILDQTIKFSGDTQHVLLKLSHDLKYIKHVSSNQSNHLISTNSSALFSLEDTRVVVYSFDLECQYELVLGDLIPRKPIHLQCSDKKAFILYQRGGEAMQCLCVVDLESKTVDKEMNLFASNFSQVKLIGASHLGIYSQAVKTLSIYCQTNLHIINKIELDPSVGESILSNDASATHLCLVDRYGDILTGEWRTGPDEQDAAVNTSFQVDTDHKDDESTKDTPAQLDANNEPEYIRVINE